MKNSQSRVFAIAMSLCIFFAACMPKKYIPFWWKSYSHPVYKFALKYPRQWETREGGELSTQFIMMASAKDPVFRTNGNIVIEPKVQKFDLELWSKISITQLGLVMDGYQLLAKAPTTISTFPANHIRGMYTANKDERIIETYLFATNDLQYVITFNFRKETEAEYREDMDRIVSSFQVPSFLSKQP